MSRFRLTRTDLTDRVAELWVCLHGQGYGPRRYLRQERPHCAEAANRPFLEVEHVILVAEAVREVHALLGVTSHHDECGHLPCTLCYSRKRLATALDALALAPIPVTERERSSP